MRNAALQSRMRERKLRQRELADLVNDAISQLTGRAGEVSERVVRRWLTGQTRWPQERQKLALEAVFGCPILELGFIPRGASIPVPPEEPVHRRSFITATATAALSAAAPALATSRVGSSDIERLETKFAALIASDHRHGGRVTIETHALALADEALTLQQLGTASQRIRCGLYACAAAFTSSAMWAAIDGRRFDTALRHFDRASSLATMSGDPTIQFRIWSHAGTLYRHIGRPADALATNDVARNLTIGRRDPMFASLGHARHAAIHAVTGNTGATQRAFGHAQDAFDRADPHTDRPLWLKAFYDQAEIDSLALSAYLSLGNYEQAEAHAHRSLAVLRPHMHRSRAITTTRLAQAQLGQGDLEPAVATAMSVPADTATRHVRVAGMLHSFTTKLHATAPNSPAARAWDQYAHDTRRNPA
ncbi:XRE family transcriptional regulator [Streptomyces fildesensis]|uniref:XRE family transcriptional regulator n=1 Tax=Streptomyces fildesensis TaxID=375757 RepID=UPI003609D0D3